MKTITQRYTKQLWMVFLLILSTISIAIVLVSIQINHTLVKTHFDKLNSLKSSLKIHIDEFFQNKIDVINTLSETTDTTSALENFTLAFDMLNKEYKKEINQKNFTNFIQNYNSLVSYNNPKAPQKKYLEKYIPNTLNGQILQQLYIINNSYELKDKLLLEDSKENLFYDKIHKKYHPLFVNILKRHKFYDIFLINTQGDIVYSVFKELDLGSNLNTDIYSTSPLSKAYKNALNLNKINFCDFQPYEPSYNKPQAFFAIPVKNNQNVNIGVLAFQISSEEINNIVTLNKNWENIGLGATGEAYLVGEDNIFRSDSRFISDIQDDLVQELQTTIGILNIHSSVRTSSFKNETNHHISNDYRGQEVLSSFAPIKILNTNWNLLVEIDKKEVTQEIKSTIFLILGVGILLTILSMVLLKVVLIKLIIEPIDSFESKLSVSVTEKTKELKDLNNTLQKQVKDQISQLRDKDQILLHHSRMNAIGDIVGNIAHQWRQPLSVISTGTSSLQISKELDTLSDKEFQTTCNVINENVQYLSKTIDGFRDFININSSSKTDINLLDTLNNTKKLIDKLIIENKIIFIEDIQDISIYANENHIIQLFLNILKNSIDAMIQNNVTYKYLFISIEKSKTVISITIKDCAGGISEEIIDKIFDPYMSTKHNYIGTGLSLYMCYELVTKFYDGVIKVRNVQYEYEKHKLDGALFTITFPV